jgi:hypothetical protein
MHIGTGGVLRARGRVGHVERVVPIIARGGVVMREKQFGPDDRTPYLPATQMFGARNIAAV